MEQRDKYIKALIELFSGLERLGPGDSEFTEFIFRQIPHLPDVPRIADLGCGTGAGTLHLAKKFQAKVKAVDFSKEFLNQLTTQARAQGLVDLVEPIESDIGSLNWEKGSVDLLWSEGAAYNITFKGALECWRPFISEGGVAVISELNYFSDSEEVPQELARYMQNVYPEIKTESENIELINSLRYQVLAHFRLPTEAWWQNYYAPLAKKIENLKASSDKIMQIVIEETEEEMAFFKKFSDFYGYTYFIMRAC